MSSTLWHPPKSSVSFCTQLTARSVAALRPPSSPSASSSLGQKATMMESPANLMMSPWNRSKSSMTCNSKNFLCDGVRVDWCHAKQQLTVPRGIKSSTNFITHKALQLSQTCEKYRFMHFVSSSTPAEPLVESASVTTCTPKNVFDWGASRVQHHDLSALAIECDGHRHLQLQKLHQQRCAASTSGVPASHKPETKQIQATHVL